MPLYAKKFYTCRAFSLIMRRYNSTMLRSVRLSRVQVFRMLSVGVIALLLYAALELQPEAGFVSSEVRFADPSMEGLAIVPASCPSSPDYGGTCSPNPPPPSSGCNLTSSSYTIPQGGSATLSWAISGDGSGTISPGIGAVPTTGTRVVTPSATTQYVLSGGTYVCTPSCSKTGCSDMCGTVGFSCQATVSVSQCPAGQHETYTCHSPATAERGRTQCVGEEYAVFEGCVCDSTNQPPVNGQCTSQCPQGQYWNGSQCIAGCAPQYFCTGNDLYYRSAQCSTSLYQTCTYGCSNGACGSAPAGSGTIRATPALIRSGETSTITWSATSVQANSCSVTENNASINDAWTGVSGTRASSVIREQTTYTLRCTGLNGQQFSASATVNIIPIFEEL